MTIGELWDSFRTEEDPASPTIDELYQCLQEESTRKRTFEVTSMPAVLWHKLESSLPLTTQINNIPGSIPCSVVNLNLKECRNKLQQDLLHIFVCVPTADFSLPLGFVLETYKSCFGHSLNPPVYGACDLPGVMGIPCVAELIKVLTCSLF